MFLKIIVLLNVHTIKDKIKYIVILILGLAISQLNLACKPKKSTAIKPATEQIIEIKTAEGTMYMWLYKKTPLHRANFLKLTEDGFFNGTTFHRIVPDFVIQGGDPNTKDADSTNDGSGGPGYKIAAEFHDSLKHMYGAVGAARDNNSLKESNGSQFYIVVDKNGEPGLNKNYTVFGFVFYGMDKAQLIVNKPRNKINPKDRPYTNITMEVKVVEKTLEQLKSEFNFVPNINYN